MAAVPPRTSLRSPLRAAARCARRWLIDDLSPLPRRCASRRCALLDEAPRCASGARCAIAQRGRRSRGLRKRRRELQLEEATSRG